MKILIVAETFPPNVNGAAIATYLLAKELSNRDHEVFVIAPSASFTNHVQKDGNLTIYRMRSILLQKAQDFRVSFNILHWQKMKKIIQMINPDVIHISSPGFLAQSAMRYAQQFDIPIMGTSHFMPENLVHYLRLPEPIEDVVNSLAWREYARIYGKLDTVICPTQTAADLLERYKYVKRCVVISNGIDLTRFNIKNNGEYLKKKFHLPDKTTLLFVGRLDKEKNLHVLLAAAAQIINDADFHIVLVGKGKEYGPLKRLAKKLHIGEHVTFTGYLPDEDLPNIYKVADIFVMPSIAELQSLVTMHAMANGLPVIAADAVALPHLVKNGENGYLFVPENDQDLAQKLLKVITNKKLREDMGKKSLEFIKVHEMGHVVKQVEDVYEDVISHHNKR